MNEIIINKILFSNHFLEIALLFFEFLIRFEDFIGFDLFVAVEFFVELLVTRFVTFDVLLGFLTIFLLRWGLYTAYTGGWN